MLRFERIGEFDVRITGTQGQLTPYIAALRKTGLRAHKVTPKHYQVSFDGFQSLRAALPEIGAKWEWKK